MELFVKILMEWISIAFTIDFVMVCEKGENFGSPIFLQKGNNIGSFLWVSALCVKSSSTFASKLIFE